MWLINNENRHNIELPPLMGMSRKMAGHEGIEPPTPGFGDQCSTN